MVCEHSNRQLLQSLKNPRTPEIYAAIESGDQQRIQQCENRGQSFNHRSPSFEYTPLQCAVLKRNPDMIQKLEELGADINLADNIMGWTALHYAAMINAAEIVNLLICLEGNSELFDRNQLSALHWAVPFHSVDAAGSLIKMAPELINSQSSHGITPLMSACYFRDVKMVQLLLDAGGDCCGFRDNLVEQNAAIHYAAVFGGCEIMKLFLQKCQNLDARNTKGYTPLHEAMSCNRLATADLLLDAGASLELEDSNYETALFYACRKDDHMLVKAMLSYGADPLRLNKAGQLAYDVVKQSGQRKYVGLLLNAMRERLENLVELCFFGNYVDSTLAYLSAKVQSAEVA